MSIFESIKNAIFGHGPTPSTAAGSSADASPVGASTGPEAVAANLGATNQAPASAATPALSEGALETQLAQLSAKSSQKLNWQTSIVDLMRTASNCPTSLATPGTRLILPT